MTPHRGLRGRIVTSTDVPAAPARSREEELYRRRTPASGRGFQEARQFLPGGDSRSTLFYPPYPAVMDRGEGCWLFDLDGNRLLDFTGNHSSLILGYGHPAVVEAVRAQLARGTCFPGSTAAQTRLASLLCERLASVELVRFTNSGTEAAMQTIRAARAFTGRHGIAKVEGGYHGTADEVMVSTHPTSANAGEPSHPLASPGSRGLVPGATGNAVVIP
ncbi:MAG: aminotransferase class III-fold pyridoxal phosphate-dependent enzyme, partial [Gemmatimonadales bacterium]